MKRRKVEVEDVPELMHHIQSRLPLKEAARTTLLSKSWLHAWSTIPTLRFNVVNIQSGKSMKLADVDRTLTRYLQDTIPIEKFHLRIDIENQDSASHAEKWIGHVASKTCLKELSLSIFLDGARFSLRDEILSGENLTKLRVSSQLGSHVWITKNPVIKCLCLRELHLDNVRINEKLLDDILSSCNLLVTLALLDSCVGFKTIKVKNHARLNELRISFDDGYQFYSTTALEISDVPNLGVFSSNLRFTIKVPSVSLGSNVTELELNGQGVITDNACLDMIASGFPFLESLSLGDMSAWMLESFHFKCASIKRLTLLMCPCTLIDVQVHAPNLLFFSFDGGALPNNLVFPVSSTLDQIKFSLQIRNPVDASFFLKMKEALALSRECYLRITTYYNYEPPSQLPLDIDIDDLRTRLLMSPPATNVQKLSFKTCQDGCIWERSPFFDAFFEICHPKHVFAQPDISFRHNNHFCRLMLRDVLEKKKKTTTPYWLHDLQHVQIEEAPHPTWETLSNSHTSFLHGGDSMHFKLTWR